MRPYMSNRDSIPQTKVARTLTGRARSCRKAVFGEIILAGGSGISPKNPALPGVRTFWRLWNEITGSASLTVMKRLWT